MLKHEASPRFHRDVLTPDDTAIGWGNDDDVVLYLRSTALSADAEITAVIEGTSNHQGVAANSLILSNITNDGDIIMLVSDGGNSLEFLLANADSADLQLGHGMATVNIKTASGDLTLAPAGDILLTPGGNDVTITGAFTSSSTGKVRNSIAAERSGDNVYGPKLIFHKSRGSISSPTNVETGDILGGIDTNARDDADFNDEPAWVVKAQSNWTDTSHAFYQEFLTNANSEVESASRLKIAHDGDITGTHGNYHVTSDERLKKDVATISGALTKVMALRGVNFKWKDVEKGTNLQMGLIAQEVEAVVPEVVHTSSLYRDAAGTVVGVGMDETPPTGVTGTKAIEYQYLVGLLVEAIKELKAQVDAL